MFCDSCGTSVDPASRFCPRCGKSFASAPLMPSKGRIAGHIRLLGILWIALSAFRFVPGIVLYLISRPEAPFFPSDVPEFVPALLRIISTVFLIGAAAGLAAGWGLLARQSWARMLAIILGAVSLLDLPFGTALGIYTFWVLLPVASEEEYRQMSRVA